MARSRRRTIDELAHETGVSSRNIRYYQTRGLLPPPAVKGRTGYYDDRHVERLALIQELRNEGLNLQAIIWLLSGATGVEAEELRKLKRAVLDEWVTDQPIEVSAATVVKGFGDVDPRDAAGARAIELQLLEPTDDPATWRVLLPAVLAAGRELNEMGVGIDRQLDVLEVIRAHAQTIAEAYVDVFDEVVLAGWDARGRPADEWPRIREAVDRIRPLAGEALLAVFNQVMAAAVAARLAASEVPE